MSCASFMKHKYNIENGLLLFTAAVTAGGMEKNKHILQCKIY